MPDLASLVRARTTWAVVGAVLAVGLAQGLVGEVGPLVDVLVFGVLPALGLAVGLVVAIRQRLWIAVGGALVGVSPAVLAGLVAGDRHAAIAVVAVLAGLGLAFGWWRRGESGLLVTAALVVVVAAVASWFTAGERREGPGPDGDAIVSTTGASVRAAIGAVADDLTLTTAVLLWAGAVGIVIGAGVVARSGAAIVVPLAVVAFVASSWSIEALRGPVEPIGGAWILAGAVAAGAALTRLPAHQDRVIGRVAAAAAAVAWTVGIVQQARSGDAGLIRIVPGLLAPAFLAGLVWVKSAGGQSSSRRGVNVIGYFDRTSGLGERARTLAHVLRSAGVDVSEWPVAASPSPARGDRVPSDPVPVVHATTVAVVTALEFPALAHTHPDVIHGVDRVIGYWFWELDEIPESHGPALEMVDEIWAPTRFVRDAYRRVAPCPVRLVPLPIASPDAARGEPPPSDASAAARAGGDLCTFVTSFDHLSVIERKNPQGVVAAFRRAFPNGDEPVRLVVKSLNAEHAPAAAARLAGLSALDQRIEIRDEHLSDDEFHELLASADAFVSLHRSEGLGLQPALAMWLGVPVICTAYSGVLDVVDADSALPVPYTMTDVVDGGGAYPTGATWADPDIAVAASAMRRIADDPAFARQLGAAGRARMQAQPSAAEAGRAVARVLAGWADDAVVDESWYGDGRTSFDSVGSMRTVTSFVDSDATVTP